jgi:hypothetical protein
MPPKHDLRGGRASADSFAMSSSIFVASMNRRFFAAGSRKIGSVLNQISYMSSPGWLSRWPPGVVFQGERTWFRVVRDVSLLLSIVVVLKAEVGVPRGHASVVVDDKRWFASLRHTLTGAAPNSSRLLNLGRKLYFLRLVMCGSRCIPAVGYTLRSTVLV